MAIAKQKLEKLLREAFPDAEIDLVDTAGDEDHYKLTIKDASFTGKSDVAQHKLVNAALKEVLKNGQLHAISITTLVS